MERPTSSSDSGTTYQVFLSFRGADTRQGFTDVLYHALTDVGIHVFRDNEEIRKGEVIGDEILSAIDQSRVFIPILSKGYASSKWCLTELAKAFGGKKKILPIFYDVSVNDVKLNTKLYPGALTKHRKTGKASTDTVRQWKEALRGAGNISGYELKDQGYGEFAKSLAREVSLILKVKHTLVTGYLVQRDDQVEALMKLLDIEASGVRFVGIHGMGGIGKTTLARVVFNKLCDCFDHSCFLADVRESSSHHKGIEKLQQQLQESGGLKLEEIKHKNEGIKGVLKMSRKKLLLVLDDIGHKEQIKYLAGDASWFGSGSRIIITTRDQSVFGAEVQTMEAEIMKPEEALRLFSMHAFAQDSPPHDYLSLSKEAVASTGRLPLALEVIGSLLRNKDKGYMVEKINRLKKVLHEDVREKLMISYEALEDEAKQIFLDIACFFIGRDKTYPMYMWEACGFDPEEGLEKLIHMSMVKIVAEEKWEGRLQKKLWMHDQLRDMGRHIARRSRISMEKEALKVVQGKEGHEDVEMLSLRSKEDVELRASLPKLRFLECEGKELHLNGRLPSLTWLSLSSCLVGSDVTETSSSLRNLAVLKFYNCQFSEDWQGWSQIEAANCLRVLELNSRSICRLPLDLPISLMDLNLSYSGITKLPDKLIGKLKNLRVINISGTHIQKLPTSIRMLMSLEELYAISCSSLEEIPPIEECTCLRVLDLTHSGVIQLPLNLPISLTYLRLSYTGITELPDTIGVLENLTMITISFTAIQKLPASIGKLKSLEELHALHCSSLKEIPSAISGCTRLRVLDLRYTGVSRFLPNLPISLTDLRVSNSTVRFLLSPTISLFIQEGDITKWSVNGSSDAIVNPTNEGLSGGFIGNADGAIHRAAGPELREACYKVPEVHPGIRCPAGEARITPGFKLPASHVIHTVGPVNDFDPKELLKSAYKNSLAVAKESNIQYIAFPAISCGVNRYPHVAAAKVAIPTVKEFSDGIKEIHFVLYSDVICDMWSSKARELLQEERRE